MKLRILSLVLAAATSITAVAQPRVSPQVMAEREMQWMNDSLHLTTAQASKATTIVRDFHNEMRANHTATGTPKKAQQAMKRKDAAMKKILSARQFTTYTKHEKMIRAIEEQRRHARGDMPL